MSRRGLVNAAKGIDIDIKQERAECLEHFHNLMDLEKELVLKIFKRKNRNFFKRIFKFTFEDLNQDLTENLNMKFVGSEKWGCRDAYFVIECCNKLEQPDHQFVFEEITKWIQSWKSYLDYKSGTQSKDLKQLRRSIDHATSNLDEYFKLNAAEFEKELAKNQTTKGKLNHKKIDEGGARFNGGPGTPDTVSSGEDSDQNSPDDSKKLEHQKCGMVHDAKMMLRNPWSPDHDNGLLLETPARIEDPSEICLEALDETRAAHGLATTPTPAAEYDAKSSDYDATDDPDANSESEDADAMSFPATQACDLTASPYADDDDTSQAEFVSRKRDRPDAPSDLWKPLPSSSSSPSSTSSSAAASACKKNPRVQGTDICDKDSKFSPLKRVKLEDEISELQRERLKLEEEKREASENSELLKAKAAKAIMEAEKADLEAKNIDEKLRERQQKLTRLQQYNALRNQESEIEESKKFMMKELGDKIDHSSRARSSLASNLTSDYSAQSLSSLIDEMDLVRKDLSELHAYKARHVEKLSQKEKDLDDIRSWLKKFESDPIVKDFM